MNQELRQRIIGAIVVTALAAIFIPMLFDDPIDDSGQSVSELVIPEAQVNAIEDAATKLPANAEEVTKAFDTAPVVDNTAESAITEETAPEFSDDEPSVDNGMEADQLPGEAEDDFPTQEAAPASLDTGLVDETQKIKTDPVKSSEAPAVTKKPVAKAKTQPKSKPAPVARTSATVPSDKTEKPALKTKSAPELQRWTIQAGSFSKKENALALMNTLRKQGLPVVLESKDSLYRLKVGPELDKKKALSMKAKLDKQGIKNILIAE